VRPFFSAPLTIPLVGGGDASPVEFTQLPKTIATPAPPPPPVEEITIDIPSNLSIPTGGIEQARAMANQGLSLNQICRELGISKNSKQYHDLKTYTGL
jgi:hypothetical protein